MTTDQYIIDYYNKFNEDKRLLSRHGSIEYINTCRYIDRFLEEIAARDNRQPQDIRILDVGAGTGAYAGPYSERGYDVCAIELVKHNMSRLKVKYPKVKGRVGNALNLKKYEDDYFDVTLVFGPMYHLFNEDDKIKCLQEAKRVTKKGGFILVAYVMNEYSVIMYAFREGNIQKCLDEHRLSEDYHTSGSEEDLYDYVRIEDIDRYNAKASLKRELIFAPDGAANYMRESLKAMSEQDFKAFVDYQYAIAERQDLIGASAHTVDVLRLY